MNKKRILTLLLVLVLVVAAATASWIAGSSIQSPAEAAARTAPPEPSPILVPVEERILTSDVVTRGTARFGLPRAISIVPSPLKPNAGVIMTLPTRNTQVHEGDVLLTISGRPVFMVQGEKPAYRDLVPGTIGDDVRQIEFALERLGFDPGPTDGVFDEQTSAAVSAWYAGAGWQAFGPTADQLAAVRALEQELATANQVLSTADAATATASLAVNAAQARAASANKLAAADVAAKTTIRNQVNADLISTKDQRHNAQLDLDAALAVANAIELEGITAIRQAVDAQNAAAREAKSANESVARVTADLDAARHKTGIQIPVDEIVFIPALPVRVQELRVVVGDAASGNVMLVTNNQLAIDSTLPLEEAQLVKPGMEVKIDEPSLGIQATGTVSRVAAAPGTDGADGFHIYFETLVDETPSTLEGFSLRLTISVKSTGGAVLAVPVSALSLAADGTTRVQVRNNDSLQFIEVKPGLSADGYAAVTPVNGTLAPGQFVVVGYENK